jgi:hypothetical protein
MPGTIDFHYDDQNDIIVATPHWKIATEGDVRTWYGQYVQYLTRYGRKIDIVFVLDDFEVLPVIGAKWGEYRAKLLREFTRFNFRVNSSRNVKLFVNTSGARYNVSHAQADSVEDAIEGVLEARRTSKSGGQGGG